MRKFPKIVAVILILLVACPPLRLRAFETDQYNLPEVPLADIGDEIAEYVEQNLRLAVSELNAEITRRQQCLAAPKQSGCRSASDETKKLEELRSDDAVATALFERIGDGNLMVTKFGGWIRKHKFRAQPAMYSTPYKASIHIMLPLSYVTISPTVRMYGHEFGTDKLEHIFQQGYKYYTIERKEADKTRSPGDPVKKAVKWGRTSERTYYGTWVSGIYSNADLAANFVGMRIYQRLAGEVKIGGQKYGPLVALTEGSWRFTTPDIRDQLLKPFISDHLNEALNPSVFSVGMYSVVRSVVRRRACGQWKRTYPDRAQVERRMTALDLWHGEDYGHSSKDRMVTVTATCY